MEIVVTGRNVEVPDHFRVHVAEKVARLERYDHKIVGLEVELFHERNRRQLKNCQRVEITGGVAVPRPGPRPVPRTSTPRSTLRSPSSRRGCAAPTTAAASPAAARRSSWAGGQTVLLDGSEAPIFDRRTRPRGGHHRRRTTRLATTLTTPTPTTIPSRAGSSAARCTPPTR